MLIPTTEFGILVLLAVSLLSWGIWTGLMKSSKWRFELFYYDVAFGVVLTAVIAAFTAGSWDQKELTFQDNFLLAGMRKMAWAVGSGAIFSLANLLLLAAVAVSGMSVAFPVAFAVAWAVGSIWVFTSTPDVNPLLAFGAALVLLVAAILCSMAFRWHQEAEALKAVKALRADPRNKKIPPPQPASSRGMILAAFAGIFMSLAFPSIEEAVAGDNGVSAYGAVLLMSGGLLGSSVVFVPFFLNFPVQGEPIQVRHYFKGGNFQHLLGLGAGMLWTIALLTLLLPDEAENVRADRVASFILSHTFPLFAMLAGLVAWHEFSGAAQRARMMLAATFVLFLAGLALAAYAPVFGG